MLSEIEYPIEKKRVAITATNRDVQILVERQMIVREDDSASFLFGTVDCPIRTRFILDGRCCTSAAPLIEENACVCCLLLVRLLLHCVTAKTSLQLR